MISTLNESNLLVLALACAAWLWQPTGSMEAQRDELDAACLKRMLHALEMSALSRNAVNAKTGRFPTNDKSASSHALAGWSLANVSLKGKAGGSLRRALRTESEQNQYAQFLKELPTASFIGVAEKEPGEPLRPDGSGQKSLVRRVAAILESAGSESAIKPSKVTDATSEDLQEVGGRDDEMLQEFEANETLRQDLNRLHEWVERASLSEQEQQVYKLDMSTDHDSSAAARQLGITEGQVRGVRKRYRDKLRKVAGL